AIVEVIKAVFRKHQTTMVAILSNQEAKEFLSKSFSYMDQRVSNDLFMMSYTNDWDVVKRSAPLSNALQQVLSEVISIGKNRLELRERKLKKIQNALEQRALELR